MVHTLRAGGLEAGFAPDAGMVCCSLRHEGEELLAQNEGLAAYAATGATMGIPLLHPWANRLGGWSYRALGREVEVPRGDVAVDPHGLPIHGVLPRRWRVVEAGAAALTAELAHPADAAFPFAHRVRLRAELADGTLRVSTTVLAEDEPVPVALGFHPYLAPPGARDGWRVSLPVLRRLRLDDHQIPTGAAEPVAPYDGPLAGRAYDDGFDRLADPPVFAVEGGGRRIEIAFEHGFPVAQVFAPPEHDFICFEPMTAPPDALRTGRFPTAAPGEPYTATFSVSVG